MYLLLLYLILSIHYNIEWTILNKMPGLIWLLKVHFNSGARKNC